MRIVFFDLKNNIFLLKPYEYVIHNIKIKGAKDEHLLKKALSGKENQILNYVPCKNCAEQIKNFVTYIFNGISWNAVQNIYDIAEIKETDIFFLVLLSRTYGIFTENKL